MPHARKQGKMESFSFEQLREFYWVHGGQTAETARQLVGVSRRTWERWRCGEARIPRAVGVALALAYGADLEFLPSAGSAWRGWRFRDGALCAPDGTPFPPGFILQAEWMLRQYRAADALRAAERRHDDAASVLPIGKKNPRREAEG